ncbi:MAG: RtcB family protein, partial [Armatimonadetes bacterium]|nr:RtcB family protein [Armatimonadota bacterium]
MRLDINEKVSVWNEHDADTLAQIKRCAAHESVTRALVLADGHKGYAVPIGGVVAYEDKISPSGVGFDIACLGEGTRVSARDGYVLPIEHVGAHDALVCWDGERVRAVTPQFGAVEKGEKPVLEVTLRNGRKVYATGDHQIFTKAGWKRADALSPDDRVAVRPYIGLPYEPVRPSAFETVEDPEAKAFLTECASTGTLAALLRLLGAVSGDGHLSADGKRLSFYTTDEDGADRVVEDFAVLGYSAMIYRRVRKAGYRTELHVCINSVKLHRLFAALGSPVGKKQWPAQPMNWLYRLPAWLRANFLSGFASAEGMTPRILPSHLPNFQIKQTGAVTHSGAIHLIARLMESLCFEVTVAPSGKPRGERQDWVLQILGGGAEQVRFLEQVGFCYSEEKRVAGALAAGWWWEHSHIVRQRADARDEARRLKGEGNHFKAIMSEVSARFDVSEGFVYHAIYDDRGAPRRAASITVEPDTTGEICWVPVQSIRPAGTMRTYDVVTGDPAHRFFGEGVVVHNCGNKAVLTDADSAEVKRKIKTIMDDVWKALSFGVGLNNKEERVDHELFDDEAWKLHPMKSLKQMAQNQLGTIGSGNHYVDIFED